MHTNHHALTTMKILRSSLFRAVCAIITGILLINNPDNTVRGITIAIGIMFLISGVISCATYISARKSPTNTELYDSNGRLLLPARPPFPIVGIGSILLGLILAVIPDVFVTSLMYVLGALLILGAVNQFMTLSSVRRMFRVPIGLWICPSLVLLVGLFVMIKPMESAALPMIILGWCYLLYGVTEIINSLKIHLKRKEMEQQQDITKQ